MSCNRNRGRSNTNNIKPMKLIGKRELGREGEREMLPSIQNSVNTMTWYLPHFWRSGGRNENGTHLQNLFQIRIQILWMHKMHTLEIKVSIFENDWLISSAASSSLFFCQFGKSAVLNFSKSSFLEFLYAASFSSCALVCTFLIFFTFSFVGALSRRYWRWTGKQVYKKSMFVAPHWILKSFE